MNGRKRYVSLKGSDGSECKMPLWIEFAPPPAESPQNSTGGQRRVDLSAPSVPLEPTRLDSRNHFLRLL